ncbi:MAG: trypsin-like peptidase domain-containing protein [Fimbriimonadales bacterium]|nr:trypsin-like peptidase domain-containing protein [Fimbriimonadales bacterium]
MAWALLAGVALGAVGMALFIRPERPALADSASEASLSPAQADLLAQLDAAMVKLVDQVRPSVVQIVAVQENVLGFRQGGQGSGVIFRSDGYIVTNDHVVAGADEVKVVFSDGSEAKGKVLRDPFTDIAVVKVDRNNLPAARFADSGEVQAGQLAIAVGSPFGLEQTVTFGHISAVGRPGGGMYDPITNETRLYRDLIQTDAAINPGNSGGPLLNYRGEVIGINTAIRSTSLQNSGVGFAIPSNVARLIAEQLIAHGKVTRAFLGIAPENLLGYEKAKLGVREGAIVRQVQEGSPAEKAGIKEGDVIVRIAGMRVRSESDLRNSMLIHRPGETVSVEMVRNGQRMTVQVKLAELPPDHLARGSSPSEEVVPPRFRAPGSPAPRPRTQPGSPARLGVQVRDLTDQEKSELPVSSGAYVVEVEPGSVAEQIGLQPGYVITRVGNTPIRTAADLRDAISRYRTGDRTEITYVWGKKNQMGTVTITVQF